MKRQFYILILSYSIIGCQASMLNSLVTQQEWSENYALLDGVTCTSSLMIDGDLETVGRTGHWILVTLPTRKPIHRIVIKGTNIEDVIVYEGLGSEGNWRKIKQVKNNKQPTIDIRVRTVTNTIRLRVGGTSEDKRVAGTYDPHYNAITGRLQRGRPFAQEIELYGFADKKTSSN